MKFTTKEKFGLGAISLILALPLAIAAVTPKGVVPNTKAANYASVAKPKPTQEAIAEPTWHPADYKTYGDNADIAYKWVDPKECDLGSKCLGMELATKSGCSSLYVELTILDENGTNLGYSNDTTSGLQPEQKALLKFNIYEEGAKTTSVNEIRCY